MSKTIRHTLILAAVLCIVGTVQAADKPFSVKAFIDQHVCNDNQVGPNANEQQIGVHVRDIASRRRVGLFSFDVSALKGEGIVFSNVSLSNLGASSGPVNVYGVIESQDNLVAETALTWNNAPGVKNDPAPLADTAVVLDMADLTPVLMTFTSPANNVRASTPASQALADFITSDTDGIITLLFAPNTGTSAIFRAKENPEPPGGTFLEGLFGVPAYVPSDPRPADREVDASRDTVLAWDSGIYAQTHDVYFGTDANQVRQATRANPLGVLVSQGQAAGIFAPGRLAFDQTYYWRIDEVNAAPSSVIYRGPVWSFKVESLAYPIAKVTALASAPILEGMGPENMVNGSGLDANDRHSMDTAAMWLSGSGAPLPVAVQYDFDTLYELTEMWIWNYNGEFESVIGFGVKDATMEYSADGVTWTPLGGFELAQGPEAQGYAAGTKIPFAGVTASHVRLIIQSNWGGLDQYGLSEVRFLAIPTHARMPSPASGKTDVSPGTALTWRPGREAAQHMVFFGPDRKAVAAGTALLETTSRNSSVPGALDLGRTYFWRVDEVNQAESPSTWAGDVWSLTTAQFVAVEDFEAYDDVCNRIFFTWLDGFGHSGSTPCGVKPSAGNKTGSTVGNVNAPFAERTVVHGGAQAMPLGYANTGVATTSMAERTWALPQDWTAGGADTLRLYVQGAAANGADQLYVGIEDSSGVSGLVNHPSLQVVQATTWQEWVIPFTEFTKAGVKASSVKRLMIGVGDRNTPRGGTGRIIIDDVQVGRRALAQ